MKIQSPRDGDATVIETWNDDAGTQWLRLRFDDGEERIVPAAMLERVSERDAPQQ